MALGSTKSTTKPTKAKATKTTKTSSSAAAKTATPKVSVVETSKPDVAAGLVKKPELVDRVIAETGLKKKDVKPIVEATLAVLAKTLAAGEELQVPPLGKVKINQSKDIDNAKIMKIKVRMSTNDLAAIAINPVGNIE